MLSCVLTSLVAVTSGVLSFMSVRFLHGIVLGAAIPNAVALFMTALLVAVMLTRRYIPPAVA